MFMPPYLPEACPYTIRPGDSLWQIAQRFDITVQEIMQANPFLEERNLRIGEIIWIPQACPSAMSSQPRPPGIGRAEQSLSNQMRLLWEQHAYWTRVVFVSTIFDWPDAEAVTARLLRNPQDFEAALTPFYGEAAAARFAELFTEHIQIAGELLDALKNRNIDATDDATRRWYANADQIAAFLASINPYWTEQEWQSMLYRHLSMLTTAAVSIMTQEYADSIRIFDNIELQALEMADTMTRGIVEQFPQYF